MKPVIGLVGGIGSGKTFLARSLADGHNIVTVEGDAAGHEVLKQDSVKAEIRREFGEGVFAPDGTINRRALGRLVFGASPERQAARARLERIVHPKIEEILRQQIAEAQQNPEVEAIILDAAILLEAGWDRLCDSVIFLDVPTEQRLERVQQNRGWSFDEFLTREASQLSLELKRAKADYVVDNSGPPEKAVTQIRQIYSQIMDELT